MEHMNPALCEILNKLEFLAMIKAGEKPCMNNMSFVNANSISGSLYRIYLSESAGNLMLHINQIISATTEAIKEYEKSAFLPIIINTLHRASKGISKLNTTYKDRPNVLSQLKVCMTNIQLQLDNHKNLIMIPGETKEIGDTKESKDTKDTKDSKDSKETKEQIENQIKELMKKLSLLDNVKSNSSENKTEKTE